MRKAPTIPPRSDTSASRVTVNVTLTSVREERDSTRRAVEDLATHGVPVTPPRTRNECPSARPCPYVSCRYNMWQDTARGGGIKCNFSEVEPEAMQQSCALDLVDENPEGLTLEEVGRVMNLTRERVRQIEASALASLAKKYNISDEQVIPKLIASLRARR